MATITRTRRGAALVNLRAVRESLGITRRKVASDTGLDYSYLWKLEEGKSSAGYETLRSIRRALGGVSENVLTGESP